MAHWKDRGYKSRKLHLAYFIMILMFAGFLATGKWPALGVTYAQFCMALLTASTIYTSSNAFLKWMGTKGQEQNPLNPNPPAK